MILDFDIPVKEIEKRKQIFSKEKQLQLRLSSIRKTLELVPDN